MRIIEIKSLSNGAHRNQMPNSLSNIPDGWAVIPDSLETPNFPFGEVEVEEVNGIMTVTKSTPTEIPEPEPFSPEPTAEERITALEDQMALADATAIELFEAQLAQEEINTAQDDALIEIFEMLEGE